MIRARFTGDDAARPSGDIAARAHTLAESMPALVQDSRRLAAALSHGVHGRRHSGIGENFWQFRPFTSGEPASRIDWRRSARDHRLYVREREWEAARTVWLWVDRSRSMHYVSDLAMASKIDRALVLALALSGVLVEAGERAGLIGLTAPLATRRIIEKLAEALAGAPAVPAAGELPPPVSAGPRDEIILISDFLMPLPELEDALMALSRQGARGHLVMISDPVEETFPFDGEAVIYEAEQNINLRIGDALSWRRDYLVRLAAFRAELVSLTRAHGWSLTAHHTDRPASDAALKLMALLGEPAGLSGGLGTAS